MTQEQHVCVLMTDGRFVDFPGRRRILGSQYIDADGSVCVRLDFLNGETRTFKIPEEMLLRCAGEGAEHVLRSAASAERDVGGAVDAVDRRMAQMKSLTWAKRQS